MFLTCQGESKSPHETVTYDSTGKKGVKRRPADEVAEESRSREVTVAADMVFSMSKNLSGVSF